MPQKLLIEGRPLLANGATGANLFEAGPAASANPEAGNDTRLDSIQPPGHGFVNAGADIFATNSFRRDPRGLDRVAAPFAARPAARRHGREAS